MPKNPKPTITDNDRDKILKAVYEAVRTREYFAVNNALWEALKHRIINPPKRGNKWAGLRWLFSRLAQFALNDYRK